MDTTIKTHNMRTGYHTHQAGTIWAENDGPSFLGYKTIIPYKRMGELVPMPSRPLSKERAQECAAVVAAAETWEAARAELERIAGDLFR